MFVVSESLRFDLTPILKSPYNIYIKPLAKTLWTVVHCLTRLLLPLQRCKIVLSYNPCAPKHHLYDCLFISVGVPLSSGILVVRLSLVVICCHIWIPNINFFILFRGVNRLQTCIPNLIGWPRNFLLRAYGIIQIDYQKRWCDAWEVFLSLWQNLPLCQITPLQIRQVHLMLTIHTHPHGHYLNTWWFPCGLKAHRSICLAILRC